MHLIIYGITKRDLISMSMNYVRSPIQYKVGKARHRTNDRGVAGSTPGRMLLRNILGQLVHGLQLLSRCSIICYQFTTPGR